MSNKDISYDRGTEIFTGKILAAYLDLYDVQYDRLELGNHKNAVYIFKKSAELNRVLDQFNADEDLQRLLTRANELSKQANQFARDHRLAEERDSYGK